MHGFIATLGIGLIISGYLATNYQGSHGSAPPTTSSCFGVTGIGAGAVVDDVHARLRGRW